MGSCCSNPGASGPELNSNVTPNVGAADQPDKFSAKQMHAILFIQSRFRGWKTRKQIKKVHGFESRTMKGLNRGVYSQSDAEIALARQNVMEIRKTLEAFKYDP